MAPSPIKIGILGLSTSPGSWARNAHLPYLSHSDKYSIVAVCNSSVESAKRSIEEFKLSSTTKAYDLAKDANVDLVVCTVRVDLHKETLAPSLAAGKDIYVEWPLGKSLADAEEIVALKNAGGVKKTTVGYQGRFTPLVQTLKKLLAEGSIGEVLSTSFEGYPPIISGPYLDDQTMYMTHEKVGGNLVSIFGGHSLDVIAQVFGRDFTAQQTLLAGQRKTVYNKGQDGTVDPTPIPKTTKDHLSIIGRLGPDGIAFTYQIRDGPIFPGAPGMQWRIYGTKGEIYVSGSMLTVHIGDPALSVKVHDFATGEVTEAPLIETDGWVGELGFYAKNVGRTYVAIAGGAGTEKLTTFEDALERHRFIDQMYKDSI